MPASMAISEAEPMTSSPTVTDRDEPSVEEQRDATAEAVRKTWTRIPLIAAFIGYVWLEVSDWAWLTYEWKVYLL